MANPLMTGFNQGVDPSDQWNKLTPDDARGPLTSDPQRAITGAAALRHPGQHRRRARRSGTQTTCRNRDVDRTGMPAADDVCRKHSFIDPATAWMTTQRQHADGQSRAMASIRAALAGSRALHLLPRLAARFPAAAR